MTIIRTAFFEAELTEEQKQDFYQYMENEVVPIIRTFPNNLGVVVNKPEAIEADSHKNLLLMMQHSYEDEATMLKALDSDARIRSMLATKVIIEKYNIHVHHINFVRS
ncbi:hypothetical protein L1D34_14710 [Vibrio mediterranei]|jgi:hypothetical protein|uniref:Uncharacterized protein n=1 Tax=Vibrio mediterranei TaxID=689 RepID=A0A3G4VFX3_9VIBR|nr:MULTISPECIES: hypothetical protein [Vibrio]AYV23664.1 hypothetical protein ECB94_20480 [Vibrio mediterranei]MCG9626090.1 hypothetical protein [Vibrio mediterranei]MDA0108765.1 hypothetical protein [Vibrio sp. La 4.2.2]NUW75804.1 hypothetical protein [Vibrio mediterranei]USE02513.1 hypothetical protein JKJ11_22905 [Vibrio sp. SCSIO 43133]